MAEVTVRVKMNRLFTVTCDGRDADEVLDDIAFNERLADEFAQACVEDMSLEEATYDEPEEEDEVEN